MEGAGRQGRFKRMQVLIDTQFRPDDGAFDASVWAGAVGEDVSENFEGGISVDVYIRPEDTQAHAAAVAVPPESVGF